ncbi:efflux RND transporter periplasmic adaptor subunit [Planococcus lenghuensis]|uniref:HlyD family secretion protein n=1 Tax=Planococcus lenghuensis TaxID=2213202 RepID=A0A1Q2L1A9_9BACL|nr:hypothetical protein [Planococcus lenghuensis]AQQ54255.1 hypothetical protein B0X71_14885 [Planococcus lenghuensis]
MNKFLKTILIISLIAFIAVNAILLFGKDSVFPKWVYVHDYAETYTGTYTATLPKAALTVPASETVISAPGDSAVEYWIAKQGDPVEIGAELAMLDSEEAEEQRAVWETELAALERERDEVEAALDNLEDELDRQDTTASESTTTRIPGARSDGTVNDGTADNGTGTNGNGANGTGTNGNGTTGGGEVNVDINIEVPQQGAYAAGIAQLEQQIAAITRDIEVVEAQLNRTITEPILLSPVNGTIAEIQDNSLVVYSEDRSFRTYVTEDQWLEIQPGDKAYIQAPGLDAAIPAVIREIAEVPAGSDEWFHAYRVLEPETPANPMAFYAVDFDIVADFEPVIDEETVTEEAADTEVTDPWLAAAGLPFGSTATAAIITEEAAEAVALPESWIVGRLENDTGYVFALTPEGRAAPVPITIDFDLYGRTILAGGVPPEIVVLNESQLADYREAPAIFMPMPLEWPDWDLVGNSYWEDYVPYLFE